MNDLRYGLRQSLRAPIFAAVAILSIAFEGLLFGVSATDPL